MEQFLLTNWNTTYTGFSWLVVIVTGNGLMFWLQTLRMSPKDKINLVHQERQRAVV